MIDVVAIGRRITECRRAKNLTQEALAQILAITPQAVSKWERSLNCPDIALLDELAGALGVSLCYLLCGRNE